VRGLAVLARLATVVWSAGRHGHATQLQGPDEGYPAEPPPVSGEA